jgi:hypothetical protein
MVDGMQCDLRSDNSDGEASSIEAADRAEGSRVCILVARAAKAVFGVGWSGTKRRVDVASALRRAVAGEDSNGDHGAGAEDVHDDCEQSKEGLSTKEAGEQDSENGVQNDGPRHALYRLLPSWNGLVAVGLHGEEVAVDAEDDASAAELERVEEGRAQAQGSTADSHYEWGGIIIIGREVRVSWLCWTKRRR